jgi:hypothetical protein
MAHAAWGLLRASGRILLEGTPEGVDVEAVRARLLAADGHVLDVHDLPAWVLTSDLPAMSAHLVVDDSCFDDGHAATLLDRLQEAMRDSFDMEHSTLPLERPSTPGTKPAPTDRRRSRRRPALHAERTGGGAWDARAARGELTADGLVPWSAGGLPLRCRLIGVRLSADRWMKFRPLPRPAARRRTTASTASLGTAVGIGPTGLARCRS